MAQNTGDREAATIESKTKKRNAKTSTDNIKSDIVTGRTQRAFLRGKSRNNGENTISAKLARIKTISGRIDVFMQLKVAASD